MSSNPQAALRNQLKQAGFIDEDTPVPTDTDSPWYLRLMLGIAGWIGALFLLGFAGFGFVFVAESATASVVLGALTCAAAAWIYSHQAHNDSAEQFAFAVSLAGQGLIVFGLVTAVDFEFTLSALIVAGVQVVLFMLIANSQHRTWCALAGLYALTITLSRLGFSTYIATFLAAVFSWLWLRDLHYPLPGSNSRALGYGAALALALVLVTRASVIQSWIYMDSDLYKLHILSGYLSPYIDAVFIAALLLWVTYKLLARHGLALTSLSGIIAITVSLFLALLSIHAPGFSLALIILIVGYANGNRLLTGLGIACLLGYTSQYYFWLEVTLLLKSILLMATGVVLLAGRVLLLQRWPEHAGDEHA